LAENPLLPHRKLQELYTLMERCRTLERKQRSHSFAREAILAAAAIHLAPGDFLAAAPDDRSAAAVAPAAKTSAATANSSTPVPAPKLPRLALAAATARGQQISGSNALTLALADAPTAEPSWPEALAWAQSQRLPFILLCADAAGTTERSATRKPASAKTTPRLIWPEIDRVCRRLHLPTLSVDGEDAVALFRCMQESALRARTGAGPAVIWASILPPANGNTRAAQPLQRLRRYLAARNIPLPA
jgi:pyruvate dehydrogenase E1 component alpha subunit